MVSLADIDAYSQAIDDLSVTAYAELKALLLALDDPNPIVFRDALLATYPELLAPFTATASEIAATWYSTLRTNSGIVSAFRPILAPPPPQNQLRSGVRYSVSPLFQPQEFIGSDILGLLAGFTQRMIADAGRDTIAGSAVRDTVRTGWARVPRLGCCAFCAVLGARGAVYKSETTAGGDGNKYHNHCRCVVVPKFTGADNDYLDHVQNHFDTIYSKALREVGSDGTLEGATAAIRELTGSH